MLESVIVLLIYLALIAIVLLAVVWALGEIGVALPPKIVRLLWLIVALIALLLIIRVLTSSGLKLRLP